MVGRDVEFLKAFGAAVPPANTVMSVKGIGTDRDPLGRHATPLHDVSLDVRAGEVLGFADSSAPAAPELARILFRSGSLASAACSI